MTPRDSRRVCPLFQGLRGAGDTRSWVGRQIDEVIHKPGRAHRTPTSRGGHTVTRKARGSGDSGAVFEGGATPPRHRADTPTPPDSGSGRHFFEGRETILSVTVGSPSRNPDHNSLTPTLFNLITGPAFNQRKPDGPEPTGAAVSRVGRRLPPTTERSGGRGATARPSRRCRVDRDLVPRSLPENGARSARSDCCVHRVPANSLCPRVLPDRSVCRPTLEPRRSRCRPTLEPGSRARTKK